jgi:hypothetical protein
MLVFGKNVKSKHGATLFTATAAQTIKCIRLWMFHWYVLFCKKNMELRSESPFIRIMS